VEAIRWMVALLLVAVVLVACHQGIATSMRVGTDCLRRKMVAEVMCEKKRSPRMVVAHQIWDMVG
jgi:hypothetical protein